MIIVVATYRDQAVGDHRLASRRRNGAEARHLLARAIVNIQQLILDLGACIADAEWERARAYFDDLRAAVQELPGPAPGPRAAGAIAHTLKGVEHALEQHHATNADYGLRHVAYLVDDCVRSAGETSASPSATRSFR